MKGQRYLFILILLSAACSGPDKAALKSTAKNYLAKNLTHFTSYEPVAFRGPYKIVESYLNDKTYIQLDDSIMEVEAARFREMGENFKLFQQRKASGFYEKKQAYFKKQQDSIAKRIKPRFTGYKLEHYFKTTDTLGITVLNKYVFCFDPKGKLTQVLK